METYKDCDNGQGNSIYPFPGEIVKKCKKCCTPYLVFALRVFEQVITEGATEYEHKRRIVCDRINLDTKQLDKAILQRHIKTVCMVLKIDFGDVKSNSLCLCGQKIIITLPIPIVGSTRTISTVPRIGPSLPKPNKRSNETSTRRGKSRKSIVKDPSDVKDARTVGSRNKSIVTATRKDRPCISSEIRSNEIDGNIVRRAFEIDDQNAETGDKNEISVRKIYIRNVQIEIPARTLGRQFDQNEVFHVRSNEVGVMDSSQKNGNVVDSETQTQIDYGIVEQSDETKRKNEEFKQIELDAQRTALDINWDSVKQIDTLETHLKTIFVDDTPLNTTYNIERTQETAKSVLKELSISRNNFKIDASCQMTTIIEKRDFGTTTENDEQDSDDGLLANKKRDSITNLNFDTTNQTIEKILIKHPALFYGVDTVSSELFDVEATSESELKMESKYIVVDILNRIINISGNTSQTSTEPSSENDSDTRQDKFVIKRSRVGYDLDSLTGESNVNNTPPVPNGAQSTNGSKSPTDVDREARDIATVQNTKWNAEYSMQFRDTSMASIEKDNSYMESMVSKYLTDANSDVLRKSSGRRVSIQEVDEKESTHSNARKKSSLRKMADEVDKSTKLELSVSFHDNIPEGQNNETLPNSEEKVCGKICDLSQSCDKCLQVTLPLTTNQDDSSIPPEKTYEECFCPIAMERKQRQMQTDNTNENTQ